MPLTSHKKHFLKPSQSYSPTVLQSTTGLWNFQTFYLTSFAEVFLYKFVCDVPTKLQHNWIFLDEVVGYKSIIRSSSLWLTFDISPLHLGRNIPLFVYNFLPSSTPLDIPTCRWSYSKNSILDQVHLPLTLGGSGPKSNQFIYSSWRYPCAKYDKNPPGVLQILW